MELSDILEVFAERDSADISIEGKLERLREYAERAGKSCPFVVGDIVTARKGGVHKNEFAGRPCIVLEIFPEIHLDSHGEGGTPGLLRRSDMRIAEYWPQADCVVEKIVASWEYEPWQGRDDL